ncbi:induced myeloid leukemia cell differentiation protein Mcl-1 isoform X2 [Macrotis lagotis]|uniref:induced myeloid leukemia cell differentiation protein Mcl-1 isoform X2 n=1 Tax=Macrotis lagotis TaxID=92651 RepID=UPI003D684E5C
MLGPFKKNAVIGLNLYCGGAGAPPSGGRPLPSGKGTPGESSPPRRDAGAADAAAARPAPIGAEAPAGSATPPRPVLFAPGRRCPSAAEAADPAPSPEDELDGYEPEPPGKRPARLSVLALAREGADSAGGGAHGSLPSTPPPAEEEEEEDELYGQSLELITRYLREQAGGAKDARPLRSGKALETLRRVGDSVQRNHETAFQGGVCGILSCTGPRRWHQKCAARLCRCCWSRSWFGIFNKIALKCNK